jgi:hypothetical protein
VSAVPVFTDDASAPPKTAQTVLVAPLYLTRPLSSLGKALTFNYFYGLTLFLFLPPSYQNYHFFIITTIIMGVLEKLSRKSGVIVGDDVLRLFEYAQEKQFALPAVVRSPVPGFS